MASYNYFIDCHEVALDADGNEIDYFETNLPHHKIIQNIFCREWNNQADNILKLLQKEISPKITDCSAMAYPSTKDGRCRVVIAITAEPHAHLTQHRKQMLWDFMDAQMTDGWGEGFYHHIWRNAHGVQFRIN